jgi:integrase/recombinase XerC
LVQVTELLDAFLSNKSPKTIEAYRRDIEDFRLFLGAEFLNESIREFFGQGLHRANYLALTYKTHLVDVNKLQPTTVNRKPAALRSFTDMAAYTLGMFTWKVQVGNRKVGGTLRDTRVPGAGGIAKLSGLCPEYGYVFLYGIPPFRHSRERGNPREFDAPT